MKRLILTILMVLCCSQAWGATYYVDPTCTYNGDGAGQSCASGAGAAGAYNTWAGITFVRGNSYLQKTDTTYYGGVTVNVAASGTATITIGSYGTGEKPIITARLRTPTTGWTDAGGGIYSKNIGTTVPVFWVSNGGWGGGT